MFPKDFGPQEVNISHFGCELYVLCLTANSCDT